MGVMCSGEDCIEDEPLCCTLVADGRPTAGLRVGRESTSQLSQKWEVPFLEIQVTINFFKYLFRSFYLLNKSSPIEDSPFLRYYS
jgi:hypothetical protein